MNNKVFFILVIIFLSVIIFTQLKLINRSVVDNDEGIYLTSFLLIDKGNLPYKKTYFSQPPGFLLSTYPGFILFGKTLQATRLTIGLWSLVGLLAILWVVDSGLLAVGLLLLIPTYYNQSLTFQSDILVTTFSLLSFATLMKFREKLNEKWFIVSVLFLNFAFWTKFDITFFPSFVLFLFLLSKEKKFSINLFYIFFAVSLGFLVILIFPFGVKEIFYNSILLRFQAASNSSQSFLLFDHLKRDVILSGIILGGLFLSLFKINKFNLEQKVIFLWSIFTLILFIFYRPLFPHHLVMLAVPFTLLFSQVARLFFKNEKLFKFFVIILLIISLVNRIYITITTSSNLINAQQKKAVEIMQKYTDINDLVVSDEEILNGVSGRLPPPELSDISYVRIGSNNLTSENFKKVISDYKPKLIIPWNGRLDSIKNFKENLVGYKILTSFSDSKNIYIRIKQ